MNNEFIEVDFQSFVESLLIQIFILFVQISIGIMLMERNNQNIMLDIDLLCLENFIVKML